MSPSGNTEHVRMVIFHLGGHHNNFQNSFTECLDVSLYFGCFCTNFCSFSTCGSCRSKYSEFIFRLSDSFSHFSTIFILCYSGIYPFLFTIFMFLRPAAAAGQFNGPGTTPVCRCDNTGLQNSSSKSSEHFNLRLPQVEKNKKMCNRNCGENCRKKIRQSKIFFEICDLRLPQVQKKKCNFSLVRS